MSRALVVVCFALVCGVSLASRHSRAMNRAAVGRIQHLAKQYGVPCSEERGNLSSAVTAITGKNTEAMERLNASCLARKEEARSNFTSAKDNAMSLLSRAEVKAKEERLRVVDEARATHDKTIADLEESLQNKTKNVAALKAALGPLRQSFETAKNARDDAMEIVDSERTSAGNARNATLKSAKLNRQTALDDAEAQFVAAETNAKKALAAATAACSTSHNETHKLISSNLENVEKMEDLVKKLNKCRAEAKEAKEAKEAEDAKKASKPDTTGAGSDAEDSGAGSSKAAAGPRWSTLENHNIPGPGTDLVGCTVGGDITKNAAKRAACEAECVANKKCVAVVFHPWGTMLKHTATPTKRRSKFTVRLLERSAAATASLLEVNERVEDPCSIHAEALASFLQIAPAAPAVEAATQPKESSLAPGTVYTEWACDADMRCAGPWDEEVESSVVTSSDEVAWATVNTMGKCKAKAHEMGHKVLEFWANNFCKSWNVKACAGGERKARNAKTVTLCRGTRAVVPTPPEPDLVDKTGATGDLVSMRLRAAEAKKKAAAKKTECEAAAQATFTTSMDGHKRTRELFLSDAETRYKTAEDKITGTFSAAMQNAAEKEENATKAFGAVEDMLQAGKDKVSKATASREAASKVLADGAVEAEELFNSTTAAAMQAMTKSNRNAELAANGTVAEARTAMEEELARITSSCTNNREILAAEREQLLTMADHIDEMRASDRKAGTALRGKDSGKDAAADETQDTAREQ